jgi:hypothetical protein
MVCNNCGREFPDGVQFCPNCGTPVSGNAGNQNGQPNYQQNGQPNYQQNNYGQPGGGFQGGGNGFKAQIKRRDIVVSIILTIVTCGIYGIIWYIGMVDDLNTASGVQDTSGGMVFLLSIVTCGIYTIYWMYKAGEKVNIIRRNQGLNANESNSILYLLLTVFGLSIVSWCLIQSELNNVASF